jgi:hypothetical protein
MLRKARFTRLSPAEAHAGLGFLPVCLALALTGCTSMEPIQVVLNPARLESCTLIKAQKVYDPPGPVSLRAAIKDAVIEAGGNAVLIGPTVSEFMTEHADIEIYLCPWAPPPPPRKGATVRITTIRKSVEACKSLGVVKGTPDMTESNQKKVLEDGAASLGANVALLAPQAVKGEAYVIIGEAYLCEK